MFSRYCLEVDKLYKSHLQGKFTLPPQFNWNPKFDNQFLKLKYFSRPKQDKNLEEGCCIISTIKDQVPLFHVRGFCFKSFHKPNVRLCLSNKT